MKNILSIQMKTLKLIKQRLKKELEKIAKDTEFELVGGYFSDSLSSGPESFGIQKSSIIFIDSDTYSSSREALEFCDKTIQAGTFIILDDYYSYKGSTKKGVKRAFDEFKERNNLKLRKVLDYGMGGAVFIISEIV